MLTHLKRPRSFPRYAISIRQPWAELILRREKSAEFRLWRLPERYWNQWLWLHTPAVMGRKEKEAASRIFGPLTLPLGGFVGRVRFGRPLWDKTPNEGKPYIAWPCCWYWPVTGAERTSFTPARGKQRIFAVELFGDETWD